MSRLKRGDSTVKVPEVGDAFSRQDLNDVLDAIETRKRNFPTEPESVRLGVILFNLGDKYAPVTCVNGEWSGRKTESETSGALGLPKCPNGHVLFEGSGLKLGWVAEE